MNIETYNIGIAKLAKAFMDRKIDGGFMWEYLKDLEDKAFIKAVNKLIITMDQVNKATNLISLIRKMATEDVYLAEQAWIDVLSEARRVGFAGKPVFKNNATKKAIECVTWRAICLSEDLSYDRNTFMKAYNAFNEKDYNEESLDAIEGPVKTMIGDITKKIGTA